MDRDAMYLHFWLAISCWCSPREDLLHVHLTRPEWTRSIATFDTRETCESWRAPVVYINFSGTS